jgi:ATP-binding cassette, subfamily B, bacterial
VQQSLASLRCTRVIIAHRLSTVVDADLILVMDEGRLVEAGKHQELLLRGGIYAELVRAQMRSSGRVESSGEARQPWPWRKSAEDEEDKR